eukprot:SAG22_NODE_512_length_9579_cov_27.293143_11_plen_98_part_00
MLRTTFSLALTFVSDEGHVPRLPYDAARTPLMVRVVEDDGLGRPLLDIVSVFVCSNVCDNKLSSEWHLVPCLSGQTRVKSDFKISLVYENLQSCART